MFDTYEKFCAAIKSASNASEFLFAIQDYLNKSVMFWWRDLEEYERKAIILLDFNPTVITSMAFFTHGWGFGGSYDDILSAIINKAEQLAQEGTPRNWNCGSLYDIVNYAVGQSRAEQEVQAKARAIAEEMGFASDWKALETLLIENSSLTRNFKKGKIDSAKDLRKTFLADALKYLRENYNKEKGE